MSTAQKLESESIVELEDFELEPCSPEEVALTDQSLAAELSEELDDFALLERELAYVASAQTKEKAAKTSLAKLRSKTRTLTPTEQAEHKAIVQRWELLTQWDVVANCALWLRHECYVCSSQSDTFEALVEHHQHRTKPLTQRWLRVNEFSDPTLPRQNLLQIRKVAFCTNCAAHMGWQSPASDVDAIILHTTVETK